MIQYCNDRAISRMDRRVTSISFFHIYVNIYLIFVCVQYVVYSSVSYIRNMRMYVLHKSITQSIIGKILRNICNEYFELNKSIFI